jgi:hypothetical protein
MANSNIKAVGVAGGPGPDGILVTTLSLGS